MVARDGAVTVFVEVKQRCRRDHGAGHEAVTPTKRRHLIRTARLYALARGLEGQPVRFDVISIDPGPSGREEIRHDENAFDEEGV